MSVKTCGSLCGKFLAFVLKANLWISVFSLFTEPHTSVMCWQYFVFLLTSVLSHDLLCVCACEPVRVCVCAHAQTITSVSCDPVCYLLTASLLFCLFHVTMYLLHMHMHEQAHTQLHNLHNDTFPFECRGWRLENSDTHSQKWAFKVVSVC